MPFPDLRTFIERLRHDRDLVEVTTPVDPYLEVAEIHRRVVATGGPALLFTQVHGADFRSSRIFLALLTVRNLRSAIGRTV